MATTIESLELQISDNSEQASKGLNNLAASLEKLKTVSSGLRMTTCANQISKIGSATSTLSNASIAKLRSLTTTLQAMSSLSATLKISASIGNQIKNIGAAIKNLDGVDFSKVKVLAESLAPLGTLGKSNLTSFISQLSKFPQMAKDFQAMNIDRFASQIQKLAAALSPLATQMNSISRGFALLPSRIKNVISANERYAASANNAGRASGFMGSGISALKVKLSVCYLALRRVASVIWDWYKESNEYIENLNLFQVSMGQFAEEALNYAQKVQEAMGIDMSEWIRNQGLFMQIATGFGVVKDKAYQMSKGLTQVSYDMSSFFNIDIETAFQKVQSGISGELEPLRRLGYALDVATLKQIAYKHGITQSIESMTQAQKSQLRYIAIMEQSKNVLGDMGRTLVTPANAMRILSQQILQMRRALGNVVSCIITQMIPYVQALVIVLTRAATSLASMMGFEMPKIDYSSNMDGLASATDEATESVQKLKQATMGFDELNILSENSSSSGNYGYDLGLDLSAYDYDFIGETDNRAKEIADKIQKALEPLTPFFEGMAEVFKGFWDAIKDFAETKLIKWLQKLGEWLKEHPDAARKIGELAAKFLILRTALKALKWLGDVTGVTKLVKWLARLVTGSNSVTKAFNKKNKSLGEQTKKTQKEYEAVRSLARGFSLAGAAAKALRSKLGGVGAPALKLPNLNVLPQLLPEVRTAQSWLNNNPLKIPDVYVPKLEFLPQLQSEVGTARNWLQTNPLSVPEVSFPAVSILPILQSDVLTATMWAQANPIQLPELLLPTLSILPALQQLVNPALQWLQANPLTMPEFKMPEFNPLSNIQSAISSAQSFLSGVQLSFPPLSVDASSALSAISLAGMTAQMFLLSIPLTFPAINTSSVTNAVSALSGSLSNITSAIGGAMSGIGSAIGNAGSMIGSVGKTILESLGGAASNAMAALGEAFSSWGAKVMAACGIAAAAIAAVVVAVVALNSQTAGMGGSALAGILKTGTAVGTLTGAATYAYASGGFPDEGQLFIAREAGAEMVGSIGRRTAVANNDQIVDAVSAGVASAVAGVVGNGGAGGDSSGKLTATVKGNDLVFVYDKAKKAKGTTISKNFAFGGR